MEKHEKKKEGYFWICQILGVPGRRGEQDARCAGSFDQAGSHSTRRAPPSPPAARSRLAHDGTGWDGSCGLTACGKRIDTAAGRLGDGIGQEQLQWYGACMRWPQADGGPAEATAATHAAAVQSSDMGVSDTSRRIRTASARVGWSGCARSSWTGRSWRTQAAEMMRADGRSSAAEATLATAARARTSPPSPERQRGREGRGERRGADTYCMSSGLRRCCCRGPSALGLVGGTARCCSRSPMFQDA